VDARGKFVLPGVVDTHVHFNEPGRTEWEGLLTGSRALAAGGGTVFCDMPLNSTPPVTCAAAFEAKRVAAEAHSCLDFAIWGGLVPDALNNMEELANLGVMGFKAFMTHSGIDDFRYSDEQTLLAGMQNAARLRLPVAVHAEDQETVAKLISKARSRNKRSIRDYLDSRPPEVETIAIGNAIAMAEATKCSLHIVHVSTSDGVGLVVDAKQRGVDVTCETCPHYLVLTDEDLQQLGAVAKCSPVLRPRDEVLRLWQRLLDGEIDLIASDHSPSPESMKVSENFFEVWGGIAGCQTMLPLMLNEAHLRRAIELQDLCRLLSSKPAQRYRLGGKGSLMVSYDADLTLVDVHAGQPLRAEHLQYRHRLSPFLGWPLYSMVVQTFVRGVPVWGSQLDSSFRGRLIRPGLVDG
jgi:allantoinase